LTHLTTNDDRDHDTFVLNLFLPDARNWKSKKRRRRGIHIETTIHRAPPSVPSKPSKTISFPEACKRYGVPAFAKIDIEGAEIEMLLASQDFLRKNPIQFALDANHRIDGKLTTPRVEQLFRECGHESETSADFGSMTTWARPSRQ
jgi:hypothetical protein